MILPPNFELNRYGLHCRLVREEDAEFIVRLRTDEKLARFIHSTSSDIEHQIQWLKEYKKREKVGLDYYFIFDIDGQSLGVNRIYNIDEKKFSTGSWVFDKISPYGTAFLAQIITREVAFDLLEFDYEEDINGTYENNVHVLKYNLANGMKIIGETTDELGKNYSLGLSKADFEKSKFRILRMFGKL